MYNTMVIIADATEIVNPYESLANAIMVQAAADYRKAVEDNEPDDVAEVTAFFKSSWADMISAANPLHILHRLQAEQGAL